MGGVSSNESKSAVRCAPPNCGGLISYKFSNVGFLTDNITQTEDTILRPILFNDEYYGLLVGRIISPNMLCYIAKKFNGNLMLNSDTAWGNLVTLKQYRGFFKNIEICGTVDDRSTIMFLTLSGGPAPPLLTTVCTF
jgi:hypothetical protein